MEEEKLNTDANTNGEEDKGNAPEKSGMIDEATFEKKVNDIVKNRLNREREAQKQAELAWKDEKTELEKELGFFRTEFGKILDERLADVPDEYKALIQKLTFSEQVEWLSTHNTEKKSLPEIPNFNKKQSDGGGEPQHKPFGKII